MQGDLNTIQTENIKLHPSWKAHLVPEFSKDYMLKLKGFLNQQYSEKKVIYPHQNEYFAALDHTAFENVKVVILGQDPYHGPNQAHGFCFSVKEGVEPPPSLKNIYKELESDLNIKAPKHGCLVKWADQGVLLLNSVLTVEASKAASHEGQGWEKFTDAVIDVLNRERENIVFVLWGSYAQKKGALIDRKKHLVINSPHPSPLSSYRGFFGSKPFSKINNYLISHHKTPIDWNLN
jgi:uracil-DNA glycosylase